MIEEEINKISELAPTGIAIIRFAASLANPVNGFQKEGTQWIMRPSNFVTFSVQHARARNIAISLRGNPQEFEADSVMPINAGLNGYSTCTLDSPRQLAACARYIERAYVLYTRGRSRKQTQPRTIEN